MYLQCYILGESAQLEILCVCATFLWRRSNFTSPILVFLIQKKGHALVFICFIFVTVYK